MSKLFIATLFIFMMNKSHAVTITINGQNQQPLANAVVWLTATDNSLSTLPVSSPFTMTQKERQFTPHILVVPKNAQLSFQMRILSCITFTLFQAPNHLN